MAAPVSLGASGFFLDELEALGVEGDRDPNAAGVSLDAHDLSRALQAYRALGPYVAQLHRKIKSRAGREVLVRLEVNAADAHVARPRHLLAHVYRGGHGKAPSVSVVAGILPYGGGHMLTLIACISVEQYSNR